MEQSELLSICVQLKALDRGFQELKKRIFEEAGFEDSPRKSGRTALSPEAGRALFRDIRRRKK